MNLGRGIFNTFSMVLESVLDELDEKLYRVQIKYKTKNIPFMKFWR